MITLLTGQPGAGKTLHAIWLIKQMAEKEKRTVYYSGIPDLTLDWQEMENPEKWYELPVGSIIVLDECQKLFRPRGVGTCVPESVAAMEVHRHKGLDIFLITQHPMLIDSNIRRLVGRHIHVQRAFGASAANIHEWGQVRENCDKQRLDSQSKLWKYPKEVFSYYKSAELHTHKFRPPLRIVLLILGPLLFAVLVFFVVSWFSKKGDPIPSKPSAPSSSSALSPSASPSGSTRPPSGLESYLPAVPGMPWTAPRYASVVEPTSPPVPVGCIDKGVFCDCYSEQGVVVDVSPKVCKKIAKTGFHRDFYKEETRPRNVSN